MSINCKICKKSIKILTFYPHIEDNYLRKDIDPAEIFFDPSGPHLHSYYECKTCNYKFLKYVSPLYNDTEVDKMKKEGKIVNERMTVNYWKKWLKNQ